MINKKISLIAHDNRKADLCDWVKYNGKILSQNNLVCTGTTGALIKDTLKEFDNVKIECKNSGPLGGDAEIAAMVVRGEIDFCVFLIDDLNPNPHEADIQMLLRQCRLHNIPVACNRYSADLMITSPLWGDESYSPKAATYIEFKRN